MGLMFSLGMVGMVFGESGGGWIADKIGIRIPLGVSSILSIPLLLLFTLTTNIPFIFVIFLLWGTVRAGVFAPGRGYIGTNVPVTHKATYIAIYSASMSLSRSFGSFIGGYIGEHIGYDYSFYFAAAVLLVGGLFVLFGLSKIPWKNPTLRSPAVSTEGSVSSINIKAPYRSRPFITQCGVAILCWVSVGIIGPFIPLLAVEKVGVAETGVGLLFTISSLVSAALTIPLGRLSDIRNKKTMMIIGMLISGAGMAGIAYSGNYGMLIGALIVQSIGTTLFGPGAVALLSETVPHYWQNTAMGIYGAFEDTGVVIGSALGGVVWEALGARATFLLIGMIPAILGAIMIFAMLRNRPVPAR
jgi:MFS family permease